MTRCDKAIMKSNDGTVSCLHDGYSQCSLTHTKIMFENRKAVLILLNTTIRLHLVI